MCCRRSALNPATSLKQRERDALVAEGWIALARFKRRDDNVRGLRHVASGGGGGFLGGAPALASVHIRRVPVPPGVRPADGRDEDRIRCLQESSLNCGPRQMPAQSRKFFQRTTKVVTHPDDLRGFAFTE